MVHAWLDFQVKSIKSIFYKSIYPEFSPNVISWMLNSFQGNEIEDCDLTDFSWWLIILVLMHTSVINVSNLAFEMIGNVRSTNNII